jgi:cell division protein FtsQ
VKRPRPLSSKTSAPRTLPKAPVNVTAIEAKRQEKAERIKKAAKPAAKVRAAKSKAAKPVKPARTRKVAKPGKVTAFTKLTPEAKRFVGATKRRKVTAAIVVAAFGLLGALILATMFTPLLAVQNLEVTGTSLLNRAAVLKALQPQIGTPLPMVSEKTIADELSTFALVDSFAVVSLPPHTLRIAITERQPICIVTVGGVDYLYDPAGVRISAAKATDNYPRIAIVGDPKGSPEFSAAIDVLLALPANLLSQVSSVDAKTKDDVSMQLRGYAGQRIIWGDGSQSVLKSKVLAALIKNQKKSDFVTFDVSSPTTPVVRYGKF